MVDDVLIEGLVLATWVHLLQFLKDDQGSLLADVALGNEEVGLEVILCDCCVVVDGYVYSCKDEVFGQLCVWAVRWGDKHSGVEKPMIRRVLTSSGSTSR